MLTISPITNVKSTINKNISFTSGVRTNFGANAVNITPDSKHEGSFFADFLGTIKQSPMFYQTLFERQTKIEKGLASSENQLNAIA